MSYFPGNIMVIDDKYDLVYHDEPINPSDKIQYKSFVDIKRFAENSGIPLISITKTDDAIDLKKMICQYDNVRLLILDLDLNDDGSVSADDDYLTIQLILKTAIEKFGYFILMINSSHSEEWDKIVDVIKNEINPKFLNNLTYKFDKTSMESAYDAIGTIGENYSMEIIYHFEAKLNEARDKAFHNYFDYEKNSWEKIYLNLKHETGLMAHNEISNILLNTIKQYLIDSRYPEIEENGDMEDDHELIKLVFETINYTRNSKERLKGQLIWTGNFYQTNLDDDSRKYALVITPECDIAQNKQLYYKIVYGFEINEKTLPEDYDPENFNEITRPVFPTRIGTIKNNNKYALATNKALKSYIINRHPSPNQHLYLLPYIVSNLIYIDFRDVNSLKKIDMDEWTLLLRINEPRITDILDKYSNLHNRKGLISL